MTCTPKQIQLLLKFAKVYPQQVAAAKAGISYSTAKRYLKMEKTGEQKSRKKHKGRTRPDPFANVWSEIKELLEKDPGLEAKTLMEWLMESHPGQFHQGQVRTLRRRVKDWRVLEGPERKEVMFLQTIHPGRQSQSDYTHCTELNIQIDGKPFPHLLYHFMLPYSRWEYVWICFSESFETLTTGFSKAVQALGAVSPEHRTDNLAAAVPIGEHDLFQKRWVDFLAHYGTEPSSNNPGRSNENGAVEKSHHLFKHALDQRLRIRGSREFKTQEAYDAFIQTMARERNRHRQERLREELPHLQELPRESWNEPLESAPMVTAWSTIRVEGATYSVPSRYIGQKLKAFAYYDVVEVFYGRHLLLTSQRKPAGGRAINYRHLIFHLMRKPGAFRNYQYREELFPRVVFRRAYDRLMEENEDRADKEYLRILHQAAVESENDVAIALELLLESNEVPLSERVRNLCNRPRNIPQVEVIQPSLKKYDGLLRFTNRKEPNNEHSH